MQHIRSISDLNPQSTGFANRASESINIIGHVLEDILNGFGGALADVTGQPHGSHLNINRREQISFDKANPGLGAARLARTRAVNATVPRTFDTIDDTKRVQDFIDENVAQI